MTGETAATLHVVPRYRRGRWPALLCVGHPPMRRHSYYVRSTYQPIPSYLQKATSHSWQPRRAGLRSGLLDASPKAVRYRSQERTTQVTSKGGGFSSTCPSLPQSFGQPSSPSCLSLSLFYHGPRDCPSRSHIWRGQVQPYCASFDAIWRSARRNPSKRPVAIDIHVPHGQTARHPVHSTI